MQRKANRTSYQIAVGHIDVFYDYGNSNRLLIVNHTLACIKTIQYNYNTSFHVLTDEKKFLYLFQYEEYDIVEIIVRGVNQMYNRRNESIDK